MKTDNKPEVNKFITRRFDDELKNILANDLNSFLAKNPFFARRRQTVKATLSVA